MCECYSHEGQETHWVPKSWCYSGLQADRCVCWELNLSLPQNQYVLVVDGPPLQPCFSVSSVHCSALLRDRKGLKFSSLLPFVLSGAIAISITMQILKVQVSISLAVCQYVPRLLYKSVINITQPTGTDSEVQVLQTLCIYIGFYYRMPDGHSGFWYLQGQCRERRKCLAFFMLADDAFSRLLFQKENQNRIINPGKTRVP